MPRSIKNSRCPTDGRATLYRYYDNNSSLLYIGIAWDELKRREEHLDTDIWGCDIRTVVVTYFADRRTACLMERNAVRAEKPMLNTNYNRAPGEPKIQSRRPVPALSTYRDLSPDAQAVVLLLVKRGCRKLTVSAAEFAIAANQRAPLGECYRRLKMAAMLLKHWAWIYEFERHDVTFSVTLFDRENRIETYAEMLKGLAQCLHAPT